MSAFDPFKCRDWRNLFRVGDFLPQIVGGQEMPTHFGNQCICEEIKILEPPNPPTFGLGDFLPSHPSNDVTLLLAPLEKTPANLLYYVGDTFRNLGQRHPIHWYRLQHIFDQGKSM